jgi:hypothetical protein
MNNHFLFTESLELFTKVNLYTCRCSRKCSTKYQESSKYTLPCKVKCWNGKIKLLLWAYKLLWRIKTKLAALPYSDRLLNISNRWLASIWISGIFS